MKLREAYRIAEANHRRSQQLQHQSNLLESQHRRDTNVMIYIRRRLAMCARKLGKLKEVSTLYQGKLDWRGRLLRSLDLD